STYPGLSEEGWNKLTRNWAIFFAFMAMLNEAVWRNSSTDFWIGFKLWGAIPLTFLFAAANIPMLLKHGLMREDAVPAEPGAVELSPRARTDRPCSPGAYDRSLRKRLAHGQLLPRPVRQAARREEDRGAAEAPVAVGQAQDDHDAPLRRNEAPSDDRQGALPR